MKRIKVLALVLVFAFAALGGAYAAWSDSIFINETVNTGTVDIQWQNASSSDNPGTDGYWKNVYVGFWPWGYWTQVWVDGTDGDPDAQAEDYTNEEKLSVASKVAQIGDEDELVAEGAGAGPDNYVRGQGDLLEITLDNGYPGYTAYVTADIANIGTIPVKCDFAELVGSEVPEWMIVRIIDKDGVEYWNSVDGQLAATPTIEADGKITVKIHEEILDNAPQLAEATFSIEVVGIQWNAHGVQQAQ